MTPDERLEAAARAAWDRQELELFADFPLMRGAWDAASERSRATIRAMVSSALAAAYPELTAGTHWLAPREMTPEMVKAAEDRDDWFPDGMGNASAESHWDAARDAYLMEGGNGG